MIDVLKIQLRIFFFLASLILLSRCASTQIAEGTNQLHFFSVGRIPVVEGRINGKRAHFIIDTGASVSVLNESLAKHFGFKCTFKKDQNVVGFGGVSEMNQAFNCLVEFGPLQLRNITFRARSMNDFTSVIQQYESVSIAGIIGGDVFAKYKITIDFKNNTISF